MTRRRATASAAEYVGMECGESTVLASVLPCTGGWETAASRTHLFIEFYHETTFLFDEIVRGRLRVSSRGESCFESRQGRQYATARSASRQSVSEAGVAPIWVPWPVRRSLRFVTWTTGVPPTRSRNSPRPSALGIPENVRSDGRSDRRSTGRHSGSHPRGADHGRHRQGQACLL